MRFLKTMLAAALVVFHLSAHATLVQPEGYDDGTRTWLRLAATVGLSMNDFRNGVGGWNSQYRLASSQEIAFLLDSFSIVEGDTGYFSSGFAGAGFISKLGGTRENRSIEGTFGSETWYGAAGRGIDWYVSAGIGECAPDGVTCRRVIALHEAQLPNASDNGTGLFLVREDSPHGVPEPGSLALMALAGGLLVNQSRKKRR